LPKKFLALFQVRVDVEVVKVWRHEQRAVGSLVHIDMSSVPRCVTAAVLKVTPRVCLSNELTGTINLIKSCRQELLRGGNTTWTSTGRVVVFFMGLPVDCFVECDQRSPVLAGGINSRFCGVWITVAGEYFMEVR
jgi:hypothetical protein